MFYRKVLGIHEQYFKKMRHFSLKNLTVFTGTVNDLHVPVKTIKFSCKNHQIFFKKIIKSQEKFWTFSGKFNDFLKENLPIYIGKFNRFYRKMWKFLKNLTVIGKYWKMKNWVQYEKEPKIEISLSRRNHGSTHNLQFAQGTVFDDSDNANSMGMLSPGKDI